MRKILLLLLTLSVLPSYSKSMRDMWLSMPENIIPYLDNSKRIEFVDYVDMHVKTDVKNLLEGSSIMDTLTVDFLSVRLNKSSLLQMRLLPVQQGDSVLCVVRTFMAPTPESHVAIYNQDWQKLYDVTLDTKGMIVKPDSMTKETFDELLPYMNPLMVEASLSVDNDEMLLQLSIPNLDKEKKTQIMSMVSKKRLKWNGKTFN